MLAYKGFNKNLTCTMGKGTFQYEPGIWYSEENARCASTGFHATDNPLDVLSYYNEGVIWMSEHPKAPLAGAVKRDSGDANGYGAVIVRGKKPKAKGKIGDRLYMVKEDQEGMIIEIGMYQVDGQSILPGIYYSERGETVAQKRSRKA